MNKIENDEQKKRKNIQKHARYRFKDDFVANHKLIQQNSDNAGTQNVYIDEQTQLIKESKESKETPDGITYHLWGDGYKKTDSWNAYLLGSNDEAVSAVKYYLGLQEIDKQAETKSTNIKHNSQLCEKSSTEDLNGFLGTMEGFRNDTTGEKFRRDNADRYVGNHQNTNSPAEPKETPRTGRNSVDNVDDLRKHLCPTQEQGSLPSSTASVNDSREVQDYRPKDKESTGNNEAITEYQSPTRTASNPVGSKKMSCLISPGHPRRRMGERSIPKSKIRKIIEHGKIMPYNRRNPGKIVYDLHGMRVAVLESDRNSSTKTICTVFDTNVRTPREQIANFLNAPIRGDYEDDDQYAEDYAAYLQSKDEVARKYFWIDELQKITGEKISVHEVGNHFLKSKEFEARRNQSIDSFETNADNEINRLRNRLAWFEGGSNGSRNHRDYDDNTESRGMESYWDDDSQHRPNKRKRLSRSFK